MSSAAVGVFLGLVLRGLLIEFCTSAFRSTDNFGSVFIPFKDRGRYSLVTFAKCTLVFSVVSTSRSATVRV